MAPEVATGEEREESADVTMNGVVVAGVVEVEVAGAGAGAGAGGWVAGAGGEAQPRTTRLTYQSSSVS
jgi:hypothetical protein